jgi:UDP-N-acetylmuramate dehydrogenase
VRVDEAPCCVFPLDDRPFLWAESGAALAGVARTSIAAGLSGLEWAVSVPGTVGGAVVGNAGAHGSDMAANFLAATLWEPGRGIRVYHLEDMDYGYRDSVLKREQGRTDARRVVLTVELQLTPESVDVLTARADGFIAHRKERQPGGASTGSMFKNPENFYAGYLIETAGLKGFAIGDAVISEKHANFFINQGEATAEDIRALIAEAWNSVREQFGIEMELEVELIGDWSFEDDQE